MRQAALKQQYLSSVAAAAATDVPVTVALVDSLSEPGADAVVWRRVNQVPHDVIMLRAGASVAYLSAAVRALGHVRKRKGNFPTQDEKLVVHGRSMLKSWKATGSDVRIAHELVAAASGPSLTIQGLGSYRAFQLHLMPVHQSP